MVVRLNALVKGLVLWYDVIGDDGGYGWLAAAGVATMTQLRMDEGSVTLADSGDDAFVVAAVLVVTVMVVSEMGVTGQAHGRQVLLCL